MQTSRQYNSCKNSCKNLQKLNTSSAQKCKYKYKTEHANITMKNRQIQVGVMETIILFMLYNALIWCQIKLNQGGRPTL